VSYVLVINTISLTPDAKDRSNPWVGGATYSERAWTMCNLVLPWYHAFNLFDDIVVTGVYVPGPGYRYIHVPEVYGNVNDILIQRQAGFDATMGDANDWVVYLNDDTMWDMTNPVPLRDDPNGVLSPSRWTRGRTTQGEALNDGSEGGYVQLHGTMMKRWATKRVPWTSLPPREPGREAPGLDITLTEALGKAGVPGRYAPEYKVWDIERWAQPWR